MNTSPPKRCGLADNPTPWLSLPGGLPGQEVGKRILVLPGPFIERRLDIIETQLVTTALLRFLDALGNDSGYPLSKAEAG